MQKWIKLELLKNNMIFILFHIAIILGNKNENLVPTPTVELTSILTSCALKILKAEDNPKPMPSFFNE